MRSGFKGGLTTGLILAVGTYGIAMSQMPAVGYIRKGVETSVGDTQSMNIMDAAPAASAQVAQREAMPQASSGDDAGRPALADAPLPGGATVADTAPATAMDTPLRPNQPASQPDLPRAAMISAVPALQVPTRGSQPPAWSDRSRAGVLQSPRSPTLAQPAEDKVPGTIQQAPTSGRARGAMIQPQTFVPQNNPYSDFTVTDAAMALRTTPGDMAGITPPNPVLLSPLKAHSARHVFPDGRPMLALILSVPTFWTFGLDALRAFPGPISVAIAPSNPSAGKQMLQARSAGYEVLAALDNVPSGSAAVQAMLQRSFSVLPGSIGVYDGATDNAGDLAKALAGGGRGLLMQQTGTARVTKASVVPGLPEGRVIAASSPEEAAKIAKANGRAIVSMPLTAANLAALLAWSETNKMDSVQIAPVSQLLNSES